MGAWNDITTDPRTHHTVAKDYFKALAFFGGYVYLLTLCPLFFLFTGHELPNEPGMALITLAFGMQGLKMADTFLNRKTRDSDGPLAAPLDQTPPAGPAPQLMPQEPATITPDS